MVRVSLFVCKFIGSSYSFLMSFRVNLIFDTKESTRIVSTEFSIPPLFFLALSIYF
jgi:hypothetical protein